MQISSSILIASAVCVVVRCTTNAISLEISSPRPLAFYAAQAGGGFISGEWTGGKTEKDPIHGGYLNATFNFNFMPNGQYTEVIRVESAVAFRAQGTYAIQPGRASFDPSFTNIVSFVPAQSQFTPGMENIIRFFPVPNEEPAAYYVGMSALQGGGQLTLKDRSQGSAGDSWGLKRP